jgi:RNA polymerase sigma factor (sigma-70 family)
MIPGHHAPLLEPGEGREMAETAQRAQRADGRLAAALAHPAPTPPAPSARYLDDLDHRPDLPRELGRQLVATARAGDARSRARLVEAFLPLIASEARRYANAPGAERLELTQEGVVGLLRALERSDPERAPFWPQARWWARQAMERLVAELGNAVVLSDESLRRLSRLKAAHEELAAGGASEAPVAALAARAGIEPEEAMRLLAATAPPPSADQPRTTPDGEPVGPFGDLQADPLPEAEYQRVLDAIEAEALLPLLSSLSDRERTVLRARFGLEGEPAQERRRIGERLGLSPERVRRIERHALGKLAAAAGAPRDRP